jgi:hypothetical protein
MKRLLPVCVALAGSVAAAQTPFVSMAESLVHGGRQLKGLVSIEVDGKAVEKRYVLRTPSKWNGSLVVGAHGGGGGNNFDRSGKVIGTDESALDDVIGRHALASGFIYASVDRDGAGNGRSGLSLTTQFLNHVRGEMSRRRFSTPLRTYLVGLSAGGGIARLAAENMPSPFDGALIIAGANADLVTRLDRQARMAQLWPLIDPRAHYGMPPTDPKMVAYAEAVGTPVEARRLWPYTGAGAVAAASRSAMNAEISSGKVSIPTIEVVGTWDDLVIRELRAYAAKVEPKDKHRLYQVEGVWHMSGDDDGVMSFQYIAESRMTLDKDVADAMGEGPSYLPTVREAFDHLVRWAERGTAPPASQTVKPGTRLR